MKRRNFLRTSASAAILAGATPACNLALEKDEEKLYLQQGRLRDFNPISVIDPGLKITRIETFSRPEVAVVRITTDNGMVGWGQISTYDADIASTVLHRHIAPLVLGQDPSRIDALVDLCIERNLKYPWSYVCRALGGVETAIWDLYGKILQKPVCELLGGEPKPVRIYGSSMSRETKPEEEMERMSRLRDELGISAFKFRVGKEAGRNEDAWPGRSGDMIKKLGSALAEGCDLLMDANSCYTPDKAIEVGMLGQEHGIVQFEEPCPYWEIEWDAEVTRSLNLKVSGGEQDNDLAQWRRIVNLPSVDIVQPDILYLGGISRTLRVAKMAGEKGLLCIPHSANHCMVSVFTLHMMRAIHNAGPYMEYSIEFDAGINRMAKELFAPGLEIRNGAIDLPEGPGWGVEFNPAWLDRSEYEESGITS
jgi:L-alanine-DL-glutamate epimerase-like enolase superfamily enzyme